MTTKSLGAFGGSIAARFANLRAWKIHIPAAVFLALSCFSGILATGFFAVHWATSNETVRQAGRSLFTLHQAIISSGLNRLFEGPQGATNALAASVGLRNGDIVAMENELLSLHDNYPQIVNIKIGVDAGLYFTTSRISNPPDTRYYVPPANAVFAIVTVRPGPDGAFTQFVTFRDANHATVGEDLKTPSTTDVRTLDWYVLGQSNTSKMSWLGRKLPGTVGSRISFVRGFDGQTRGTLTIDVGQNEITEALQDIRGSGDENLAVFDNEGNCFGSTSASDEGEASVTKTDVPPQLCGNALDQTMFDAFKASTASSGRFLDPAANGYFMGIDQVALKGTAGESNQLYLGMATLLSVLEGPFRERLLITLGIILSTLIFALPISLMIARRFARPIVHLRTLAADTLRLNFEAPKAFSSNIIEISALIESFQSLRVALQNICRFVPEGHVKRIISGGSAKVFGERRTVSLLMTDVTGFTTMAEQLEPERLLGDMTEYFAGLTQEILEEGGTIDKFVGDAIFSYWNGVFDQQRHVELSCRAALRTLRASARLAAQWQAKDKQPWQTRIGLHSGDVIVGNIGSDKRLDFTVIGGAVNLASRIEGLNKIYGTAILASDAVKQQTAGLFLFRTIDRVVPKGSHDVTLIHELVAPLTDSGLGPRPDDATIAYCARWEQAQQLYMARDWLGALNAFTSLSQQRPDDLAARIYIARCGRLIATPPSADWDGVEHYDEK